MTLEESVVLYSAFLLLNLFVIMFQAGDISSPRQLWEKHKEYFCEDIVHRLLSPNQGLEIQLTRNIKDEALRLLEDKILQL